MAHQSNLKLYNVPFEKDENFILDDAFAYLFGLTPVLEVPKYQFVYPQINLTIKVRLSYDGMRGNYSRPSANYAMIQTTTDYPDEDSGQWGTYTFYFVDKIEYIDTDTVRLTLTMDTLNTFVRYCTNHDSKYIPWSNRTLTRRRHKDRFYYLSTTSGNNTRLCPIIDDYPENVPCTMVKTKELKLTEDHDFGPWYMIYRLSGDNIGVNFLPTQSVPVTHNGTNFTLTSIWDSTDFSQQELWKIVEIPYCPLNSIIPSPNRYDFAVTPSIPSMDSYGLQVKSLTWTLLGNNALRNMMNLDFNRDVLRVKLPVGAMLDTITKGAAPKESRETKLFNSAFMQNKFVYGSNAFQIKLELLENNKNQLANNTNVDDYFTIAVTQIIGKTLSNAFAFKFDTVLGEFLQTDDFEKFLIIDRNNEVPIYRSNYLDYVRTGYNYDKQAQNLQLGSQVLGLLKSSYEGVSGGASMGAYDSIIKSGFGIGLSSLQIQKSWAELKKQSINVSGSGDLTLFDEYTDGKMWYMQYEPIEHERKLLADMFRLQGYATNEYGIPDTRTRLYFNYLQCDAVFDMTDAKFNPDLIADVKEKMSNGVTFIHLVDGAYDFEQQYENWEISLM